MSTAAAMADLHDASGVSHVVEIPPDPHPEGGEWQLLVAKLQDWWAGGELQTLWASSRQPLTLLVGLLFILAVLQVAAAVLVAVGSVPLLPGLLELVGLGWLLRHGLPRLLRSSDRQQLQALLDQRWRAFRGTV